MRTKMSIDIILLVVTPVAYTAISANERTFAQGRGAGICNRSGRLSVGWGGVCRYSWRVPKRFQGKVSGAGGYRPRAV